MSLDEHLNVSSSYKEANNTFSLSRENLSASLTSTADEIVSKYGSETTRRINRALDVWHFNWNLRGSDDSEYERYTFTGDPLRFWWLAKLYLILYIHHFQSPESQKLILLNTSTFASDVQKRMTYQTEILSWLLQFRQQEFHEEQYGQGSILCKIMNRSDIPVVEAR